MKLETKMLGESVKTAWWGSGLTGKASSDNLSTQRLLRQGLEPGLWSWNNKNLFCTLFS